MNREPKVILEEDLHRYKGDIVKMCHSKHKWTWLRIFDVQDHSPDGDKNYIICAFWNKSRRLWKAIDGGSPYMPPTGWFEEVLPLEKLVVFGEPAGPLSERDLSEESKRVTSD